MDNINKDENDCTKIDDTNCCGDEECCFESQSDLEKRLFFENDNSESESDSESDSDENNKKEEPNKDEKSDTPIIPVNNKNFLEMKSMQEVMDESKLKTEQELIKLGQQLKEKEQEQNNLNNKFESNKKIIEKYKSLDPIKLVDDFIKNKKYIELKELMDVLFSHESIVNQKLMDQNKKVEKLDTQLDDSLQDNKDLMQENNDLEDKEENYWKPRVEKLRNKLIERNKNIKYMHIVYSIVIFHTFIFTKFGLYSYLSFWNELFYILYKIVVFLIFLLPNLYKIITNTDNYYFFGNLIIEKINNYNDLLFEYKNILIEKIINTLSQTYSYLIYFCIGISTFFIITVFNKLLVK